MNDERFWQLIARLDWSHEGDDEKVVAPVIDALAAMPPSEIVDFERIMTEKLYALDGRVWARESGESIWWEEPDHLSTDAFLYARCVVVVNGGDFYEAVLADPSQMPKDMEFESLLYIALKAYERATGKHFDDHRSQRYETFMNEGGWPTLSG